MPNEDSRKQCDIGVIGLGVMGRNFAANMAERGFAVAGYDRDPAQRQAFIQERSAARDLRVGDDIKEFIGQLARPRSAILLVPAGALVDAVIDELLPLLEAGDLIIDSGNSRFADTDRRSRRVEALGYGYIGMGISGGERGARRGPSLMPGGNRAGYERVRPILEAAAARVGPDPCVAYLGPGSAGHYVKMVHNGIEYGLMQLIAETYDLMRRGLGMRPAELHAVYQRWNRGALASFLIEITADIFAQPDARSGQPLIDAVLDVARQKGTGEWTAWEALDLQVPTFNIDVAVMMRDMSQDKPLRQEAGRRLPGPERRLDLPREAFLGQIENALYAAMIVTYVQGLALLAKASGVYGYNLDLETVARIWRGGCIIRAALLEDIRSAVRAAPAAANLLLDAHLGQAVAARVPDLREVVRTAAAHGLPAPGLMLALAYFDALRSGWLPANLIMAQRDYFGAHTYERVDAKGTFHTRWALPEEENP
jgi:6-phosphogluconate dehydrogenase